MNRKVKKGSALVTVMLFSLLFLTMSSVSVFAVINTLKGNSGESLYQSLYYEAEAGIEKAMAHLNVSDYSSDSIYPMETVVKTMSFTLNYGTVSVNIKKTGDKDISGNYINKYFLVESTAKEIGGNESRTIKSKLRRTIIDSNIFKYTICGKVVGGGAGGAFAGLASNINSSDIPFDMKVNGAEAMGNIENANFVLPDLNAIPHTSTPIEISGVKPRNALSKLDAEASTNPSVYKESFTLKNSSSFLTGSWIGYYDAFKDASKPSNGTDYTIYLVNADELVIDLTDDINSKFEKGCVIICTGRVTIKGKLELAYSSIISKEIKIEAGGSFTISYPPFDADVAPAYSPLVNEDLEKMNSIIQSKSSNWFTGTGSGGSGSAISIPSDYE